MKLFIMQLSVGSCHFLLGSGIFLSTLFSKTLSQCYFLNSRGKVSPHIKHRQNYGYI